MHKWLQRGLFVCLTVLVIEGTSPFRLMDMDGLADPLDRGDL